MKIKSELLQAFVNVLPQFGCKSKGMLLISKLKNKKKDGKERERDVRQRGEGGKEALGKGAGRGRLQLLSKTV
ncbi:hypothetical protein [Parasediminibacterium sp. JCM 36343]|uniref:hypothetical protein n=1 Tax=Parasediminibacterium sp. JCM 36343 TaxID=3374279 RepID=UPI0039781925